MKEVATDFSGLFSLLWGIRATHWNAATTPRGQLTTYQSYCWATTGITLAPLTRQLLSADHVAFLWCWRSDSEEEVECGSVSRASGLENNHQEPQLHRSIRTNSQDFCPPFHHSFLPIDDVELTPCSTDSCMYILLQTSPSNPELLF